MEYFNNKLCIEAGWLIEENIFSESNYKLLRHRNNIDVVRRACLNTPALVTYDSIPERFKKKIKAKIGDPKKIAVKSTLANLINEDEQARNFYREYLDAEDRHLSKKLQDEYTVNASILSAIHRIVISRPARSKAIGGKSTGMWPKLATAVSNLDKTVFNHSLPPYTKKTDDNQALETSGQEYRRLQDKYNRYKATDTLKYKRIGYESLIHGNLCNNNSEKINDEAKFWLVSRWSSMVNRIASENQLLGEYNEKADCEGWKTLKRADTIHNFLFQDDIKPLWWAARYGEQKFKEKFAYQHKTILPTMRNSLWYSDGTKLNYYYQYRDEQNRFKIGTTSVYEIMDVYSECLVGYYVDDKEDYITQYNAYRMALQFSGEKPYQITYDNQGGHKKLEAGDFLTQLAHLNIRTKPYNGKSKTIENAFYRFQNEYLKRDWFFTGQNIQSKMEESKANLEFIMANKYNLPTLDEVKEAYLKRRNEWQNAKRPNSEKSRLQLYKESSNPKAVKLELMDMVDLFWVQRKKQVQATAYGINFEEKGQKYYYMVMLPNGLPDVKWLARNIDKKFVIKFDPNDSSLVYLYEDTPQGLRFITEALEDVRIHRGKQEQEDWEMKRWSDIEASINEMRDEMRDELMELQRTHNQLPEQHGLISPAIKGQKTKKQNPKNKSFSTGSKTGSGDNFGRLQKAMSNVVMAGDDDDDYDETELYNIM